MLAGSELVAATTFYFFSSYVLSFNFSMVKSTVQEKENEKKKKQDCQLLWLYNRISIKTKLLVNVGTL